MLSMELKMRSARAVVADIGGTNARFAVADLETCIPKSDSDPRRQRSEAVRAPEFLSKFI